MVDERFKPGGVRLSSRGLGTSNRAAFTLLELTLSIAILALLMGSTLAMMALAGRAIPTPSDADQQGVLVRQRLNEFAQDLAYAKTILSENAWGIAFTVNDRDGNAIDDEIGYGWSGTPGAPLIKNAGGVNTTIFNNLQQLEITLTTATRTRQVVSGTIDSTSDQLLASYTGPTANKLPVDGSTSQALCIVPTLASNVTHWRPTRIRYRIQAYGGKAASHRAVLYAPRADGWLDDSGPLLTAAVTQPAAAADTQPWIEVSIVPTLWRSAGTSLWMMLIPPASGVYQLEVLHGQAASLCYTDTKFGFFWQRIDRSRSFVFEAFGRVRTPNVIAESYTVATSARLSVTLASGETIVTHARLFNEPEVP